MRSAERPLLIGALAVALGCGSSSGGGSNTGLPDTTRNVMQVTVVGTLCANNPGTYLNEPCVRVTVCTPGTQTCQTIDDILVDTGSFGLRILKDALTVPLTPVSAGAGQLAECVQFGDLSADWGPVEMASVVLGGEPAVTVPIQVVDAAFPGQPPSCHNAQTGFMQAGYKGILGVGVFAVDCGDSCATAPNTGIYFACTGSSCTGVTVPIPQQVTNPVVALPQDNNGIVVQLPAVPAGGSPSLQGSVLLGIGTALNNAPPATVTVLDLDGLGEFRTTLGGQAPVAAFADTGSNGFFFQPPPGVSLPACTSNSSWFCPSTTTSLTATNGGASGASSVTVPFQIANFDTLTRTSSNVFSNLGGPGLAGGGFDWGLPFFFGRTVFVGFEGRTSTLGTGPYIAH